MTEAITWWLAVELLGAIAFPIAFTSLRSLPDRGFTLAKIIGLLLLAYFLWLGSTLNIFPSERWSVGLVVGLTALASGLMAVGQRRFLRAYLSDRWRHLLVLQVLSVAAFAVALFLHSYSASADITYPGSEKPTDNAILNALVRSPHFPPKDPWLSGYEVNYYYFGYVPVSALSEFTDVPTHFAFNLGPPMVVALVATGMVGLIYNLIMDKGKFIHAILFGLGAVFFFTTLSNLEGVFELLAVHGIGNGGFYSLIDIERLDGPRDATAWYPTEAYWWFRAFTFMTGWEDNLFPFHYVRFGELRPQVLAFPMLVLATGSALNLWRSREAVGSAAFWRWPVDMLIPILAIGSLAVSHTWDAPPFFLVLVLVAAVRNYTVRARLDFNFALRTASFAVVLLSFAVIAFLPFYQTEFGGFEGIELTDVSAATKPHHFVYMWLPHLWLAGTLAVVCLTNARLRLGVICLSALPALLVFMAWAAMFILDKGRPELLDEVTSRRGAWVTAFMLFAAFSITVTGLLHWARSTDSETRRSPLLFGLVLSTIAIAMLFAIEFFFVKDVPSFPPRRDHMFRINMEAWFLFSIAGALGIYYVWTNWARPRHLVQRIARNTWAAFTVLILLGGFVYPLLATVSTTDTFSSPRNLDGLFLMHGGDRQAILWLKENVKGTPVILEAFGLAYTGAGRISAFTGLPSLLGSDKHEYWWRGSFDPQAGRREDIERAYMTADPAEAQAIIGKYGIEYVYTGIMERGIYGEAGLAKFASFMDVVFQNEFVTIYRVRRPLATGIAGTDEQPVP